VSDGGVSRHFALKSEGEFTFRGFQNMSGGKKGGECHLSFGKGEV